MTAQPVPPPVAPESKPNFIVGIVAALVGALLGAVVYAAVAVYSDNEIGYLAALIGVLAGVGLVKFGRVKGTAAIVIAGVIGLVVWMLALLLLVAWIWADNGSGNVFSNLGDVFPDATDYWKAYFEEDGMGYVFALFAAGGGLLTAATMSKK